MQTFDPLARLLRIILLGAALSVIGCAGDESRPAPEERSVETIYNSGLSALLAGNYNTALQEFENLDRRHPYSSWATRSQVMVAYVHYLQNNYEQAIQAAGRFVELHPGNKDIAYVRHLIALCHYEQIPDVRRDQSVTQRARMALEGVISRYPDTRYARDAALKLDLVIDHLAGKEMTVGRTYQSLRQYTAALIRFGNVVRLYPRTSHVPEALARLVETNLALGIEEEARAMGAVLSYNYPKTNWYAYAYDLLEGRGPELREPSGFLGLF